MNKTIVKLEKIAATSNDRTQRNINNLIGRIKHFESIDDKNKLENCIAESELWIN